MIVWLKRLKVEKEEGHIIYIDLYQDTDTGTQYWGTKDGLTPRLQKDGTPFVGSL